MNTYWATEPIFRWSSLWCLYSTKRPNEKFSEFSFRLSGFVQKTYLCHNNRVILLCMLVVVVGLT